MTVCTRCVGVHQWDGLVLLGRGKHHEKFLQEVVFEHYYSSFARAGLGSRAKANPTFVRNPSHPFTHLLKDIPPAAIPSLLHHESFSYSKKIINMLKYFPTSKNVVFTLLPPSSYCPISLLPPPTPSPCPSLYSNILEIVSVTLVVLLFSCSSDEICIVPHTPVDQFLPRSPGLPHCQSQQRII